MQLRPAIVIAPAAAGRAIALQLRDAAAVSCAAARDRSRLFFMCEPAMEPHHSPWFGGRWQPLNIVRSVCVGGLLRPKRSPLLPTTQPCRRNAPHMMAYPAHVQVTNINVQSKAGPDPRLLVNAEQDGFKVLPETRCVLLSDEGGQRDGDQRGAAGVSLLECKSLCAEDDWGCKPCRVFSWCKGGSDGCGTCDARGCVRVHRFVRWCWRWRRAHCTV